MLRGEDVARGEFCGDELELRPLGMSSVSTFVCDAAGATERGLRTVDAFPRPAERPMLPADTPRLSDAVAVAARPRGLVATSAKMSSPDEVSIALEVPSDARPPLVRLLRARARRRASFFSACCLRIFSRRSCLMRSASGSEGGRGALGRLGR